MNHLPLTLPLRYLGWSDVLVKQIDAILQPQIDAGCVGLIAAGTLTDASFSRLL